MRGCQHGYDAIAADYADHFAAELDARPYARAMLATFAELVRSGPDGIVADVGCGPGHVTAHLEELGLRMIGVDLSAGMATVARRRYPGTPFVQGSMMSLGLPDRAVVGVVAWYSIIHLAADEVGPALDELHRVLVPGGRLLLAFQVGDTPRRLTQALGHDVSLEFQRWRPERIVAELEDRGFVVEAQLVRQPCEDETVPHAHLMAQTALVAERDEPSVSFRAFGRSP